MILFITQKQFILHIIIANYYLNFTKEDCFMPTIIVPTGKCPLNILANLGVAIKNAQIFFHGIL